MTTEQGQGTEGIVFWRTSFFGCLWVVIETFSNTYFQQNMQAGILATQLMHLKQKEKYVENVKSAPQAGPVIQKTAFSG